MPVREATSGIEDAVLDLVPRFSPFQQRLGVALYRRLSAGAPVPPAQLAKDTGASASDIESALGAEPFAGLTFQDDEGRVIGFGGLSLRPMHHRFVVDGRVLYTWCAWDALFIPEMLGATAEVESGSPASGETIRLTVAPDAILSTSHPRAVVSFKWPDEEDSFTENVQRSICGFCEHVFLFPSRAEGEAWQEGRAPGELLDLERAFDLGQRKNALQFPELIGGAHRP